METHKIALRCERDFGEVFNAAITFVRQEQKTFGLALLVFIIPATTLLNLFSTFYSASIALDNKFWTGMINAAIVVLAQTIIITTVYSYLHLYLLNREISIKELFIEFRYQFLRIFWAITLTLLVVAIAVFTMVAIFSGAPWVAIIAALIPSCYIMVSLSMLYPSLIFEDMGFLSAIIRSFKLTNMRWWLTFLILLVSGIILFVMLLILNSPVMLISFLGRMHNNYDLLFTYATTIKVYRIIISCIGTILYMIPPVLISFHYFSLVEMREKTSLSLKIEEIGKDE